VKAIHYCKLFKKANISQNKESTHFNYFAMTDFKNSFYTNQNYFTDNQSGK
jgi:hypothetical protein